MFYQYYIEIKRAFHKKTISLQISIFLGYGRVVTKTDIGKMATIVFAIFTIPLTIRILNIISGVVKCCIQLIIVLIERKLLKRDKINQFKAKCFLIEILVCGCLLTLQAGLFVIYGYLTESRFTESFYSVFITSSTIGFGDFEYNLIDIAKKSELTKAFFQTFDLLLKYFNLAMVASVFSTMSQFQWKKSKDEDVVESYLCSEINDKEMEKRNKALYRKKEELCL